MNATGAGAAAGTAILPGIGTAVGAVGGGIIDFLTNQSSNAQNQQQFEDTMAFNKEQITSARQYNTEMANTAHQREMADLRAAGINPMMTAMGGNGAPTLASPITSAGVGNAARPAQIGSLISGALPSALQSAKTVADTNNVQKDTFLKEAAALETTARTTQATANARQLEELTRQLKRGRDAQAAESDARKNKATIDLNNDATDRLLNQIKTGSGIVNNASDVIKNFLPSKHLGRLLDEAYGRGKRAGEPVQP